VAIVAILASIVIPSYQETLRKSRRADAKAALEDQANRLERYYAEHNRYEGATLSTDISHQRYYSLSLAVPDATHFTITATRVSTGPQASDAKCGDFTLDQNGVQGKTGTGTVAECW
jgi:type IV pilus assembly protein PilE